VKKSLKIDQHLPKLWAIKYRVVFMKHCMCSSCYSITITTGKCESVFLHKIHYFVASATAVNCSRIHDLLTDARLSTCRIFTSAKEVMFSSALVSLFDC